MPKKEHILYCDCSFYDFVGTDDKQRIIGALKDSGLSYSPVVDLCKLCADGDERLAEWAGYEKLTIIACYPRAVRWLFHAGGVELDPCRVDFFNVRHEDEIERLLERFGKGVADEVKTVSEQPSDWVPWFPVIDYSRCTGCQKCLDFCLFGTYELSPEGKVRVEKPRACKTDCPACARICPQSAIIFPKYSDAPINGAQIVDEAGEATGIDHDQLLQDSIYEKLKERGKGKRFSKDAPEKGLLEELQAKFDIPAEVLANLSPAEIAHARERLEKGEEDKLGERGRSDFGE